MLNKSQNIKNLYQKENQFGFIVHTQGLGIYYRNSKLIHGQTFRNIDIDFINIKHPKEIKSYNPIYYEANSYVYGKLNSLFALHIGRGLSSIIFDKARRDGVEVRGFFSIGPSFGIVKPVYLYIIKYYSAYNPNYVIERYQPDKHDMDNIYGRAPFTAGLEKISLKYGLFTKGGIMFEFSSKENRLQMLETGFILDFFTKPIEIMAYNESNNIFLMLYISLSFGRKK